MNEAADQYIAELEAQLKAQAQANATLIKELDRQAFIATMLRVRLGELRDKLQAMKAP